jgi:hypothetical protein
LSRQYIDAFKRLYRVLYGFSGVIPGRTMGISSHARNAVRCNTTNNLCRNLGNVWCRSGNEGEVRRLGYCPWCLQAHQWLATHSTDLAQAYGRPLGDHIAPREPSSSLQQKCSRYRRGGSGKRTGHREGCACTIYHGPLREHSARLQMFNPSDVLALRSSQ